MSGLVSLGTNVIGRLLPARFRGAVFYIEDAGGTHGRRHADHEYPGRDVPFAEDMGRKQRVWPMTGYVIGRGFRFLRDALIRACERKGPGSLYHPALGTVQAVCRTCTWTEQREAGNRCVFTLEFAEAGELLQPTGLPDTAQLLEVAADALGVAAEAAFVAMFNVNDALSYVADFAETDVQGTAVVLERMRMPAYGYDQSEVSEALDSLYNDADHLVDIPPELARRTAECFEFFSDAAEPYSVGMSMLTFAAGYTAGADYVDVVAPIAPFGFASAGAHYDITPAPEIPPNTELNSRAWLVLNQNAWQRFAREQALREVGYLTPAMNFNSYDDADRVMTAMTEAFDMAETAAADAGNDEVYLALIDLRGACMADIMSRRGGLAPLVNYRMPRMSNAITMAWRFYQDANRNLELVEMAGAYTPAFMPMAGKIKVN